MFSIKLTYYRVLKVLQPISHCAGCLVAYQTPFNYLEYNILFTTLQAVQYPTVLHTVSRPRIESSAYLISPLQTYDLFSILLEAHRVCSSTDYLVPFLIVKHKFFFTRASFCLTVSQALILLQRLWLIYKYPTHSIGRLEPLTMSEVP